MKRKMIVASAAIAAAFALPGCAPAGYNADASASDYGAQPAANAVDATPGATASPDATASPGAEAEEGGSSDTPLLDDDEVTTELKAESVKQMGETVQNQDGFVLYRFDKDKNKPEAVSNCNAEKDCERIWPPSLVNEGEQPKLEGVDSDLVGTVKRKDGTLQLTLDNWPLYTYVGDKKPGQWKGQNVGGTWFVITPEGKKNLTCLPKISKPVAPPAESAEDKDEAGSGSGGSDYSY